jgi:N-alpha-acetyltransferase 35, NatC auxiliary subunit
MDPKMDSGCFEAEESEDGHYDVSRPLLPEETLGIVDQLLCHEVRLATDPPRHSSTHNSNDLSQMAWHLGYPLSQTLFTNVYIEAILIPTPTTIHEAAFTRNGGGSFDESPMLSVLRAYCVGMLKTCGYVNERIRTEHFYEVSHWVA